MAYYEQSGQADEMHGVQSAVALLLVSFFLGLVGCSNKIVPVISTDKIEIPQRYKFMGEAVTNLFPNNFYKFSGKYPTEWPDKLLFPADAFVSNTDGSITTTTYENQIEMHVKMLAKMDIVTSENYCTKWFNALDTDVTFGHVSNEDWKGAASFQKGRSKDSLPWLVVTLNSDNRLPEYTVISVTYRKAVDANQ